ncbi:MAG: hypothetical protein ACQESS_09520 [Bacillota bacterium]
MILTIFLSILLLSVIIIITVISLPYYYKLKFGYHNNFTFQLNLIILFLNFKLHYFQKNKKLYFSVFNYSREIKGSKARNDLTSSEKQKNDVKKDDSHQSNKNIWLKKIRHFHFPRKIITKENMDHIFSFLIKLFKKVKPAECGCSLLGSFTDPYYNGIVLAAYSTLINYYPNLPVNISILWPEKDLKIEGKISGRIIPAAVIFNLLIFFFSKKSINILWNLYVYKKSAKKGGA